MNFEDKIITKVLFKRLHEIGIYKMMEPTFYNTIAFGNFIDMQTARISNDYISRIMPRVKEDAGTSFSLYNATTGTEVSDLFFWT